MNKFLKLGMTILTLAFVFGVAGAGETKAQILQQILTRMDTNNKLLKSLQANVKMDKLNSQLDEHDITEGTVRYLPGSESNMYVRIDWTKPIAEQLAVAKGQYVLYRPHLKQAIVGKVSKAQGNAKANGALAFMSMSKAQLKANYTVTYIGEEKVNGTTPTWHLLLTPKAANTYKSADLWVDGDGMPVQAKVTEKNDDTTTVLLTSIQKNIRIPGDIFSLKPPKDTKIIAG